MDCLPYNIDIPTLYRYVRTFSVNQRVGRAYIANNTTLSPQQYNLGGITMLYKSSSEILYNVEEPIYRNKFMEKMGDVTASKFNIVLHTYC